MTDRVDRSIVDRYLSDVCAVKDARDRGRLAPSEADSWIARLDDAIFLAADLSQVEDELEGYVLLDTHRARIGFAGTRVW